MLDDEFYRMYNGLRARNLMPCLLSCFVEIFTKVCRVFKTIFAVIFYCPYLWANILRTAHTKSHQNTHQDITQRTGVLNLCEKSRARPRDVDQQYQFTFRVTDCLSHEVKCRQRHNDQPSTVIHLSITHKCTILQPPQMHTCKHEHNIKHRHQKGKRNNTTMSGLQQEQCAYDRCTANCEANIHEFQYKNKHLDVLHFLTGMLCRWS